MQGTVMARRIPIKIVLTLVGMLVAAAVAAPPAGAATATAQLRSFSCTGGSGEAFTVHTVTGSINRANRPTGVTVTQTASGTVESVRPGGSALVGASVLHPGYTEWNVTGPNPNKDTFHLNIPEVLPGAGGFFDADLDIEFAGGVNGALQIPMFDCTVTGGPAWMSTPDAARTFTCTGGLGEAFTIRTVTGSLTPANHPLAVSVIQTGSGLVDSYRPRAKLVGVSVLHAGYTEWNVTGPNPNKDTFHLNIPPVLPGAGGLFDADLDIEFAGGVNGAWQIPMFDCSVEP